MAAVIGGMPDEGAMDGADPENDAEDGGPDDDNKAARLARLARKAESARLARLRHKQFVQDKQNEVALLQKEEDDLLAEEAAASSAALETVRSELRKALNPEQIEMLKGWLADATGGQPLIDLYINPLGASSSGAPRLDPLPPPPKTVAQEPSPPGASAPAAASNEHGAASNGKAKVSMAAPAPAAASNGGSRGGGSSSDAMHNGNGAGGGGGSEASSVPGGDGGVLGALAHATPASLGCNSWAAAAAMAAAAKAAAATAAANSSAADDANGVGAYSCAGSRCAPDGMGNGSGTPGGMMSAANGGGGGGLCGSGSSGTPGGGDDSFGSGMPRGILRRRSFSPYSVASDRDAFAIDSSSINADGEEFLKQAINLDGGAGTGVLPPLSSGGSAGSSLTGDAGAAMTRDASTVSAGTSDGGGGAPSADASADSKGLPPPSTAPTPTVPDETVASSTAPPATDDGATDGTVAAPAPEAMHSPSRLAAKIDPTLAPPNSLATGGAAAAAAADGALETADTVVAPKEELATAPSPATRKRRR